MLVIKVLGILPAQDGGGDLDPSFTRGADAACEAVRPLFFIPARRLHFACVSGCNVADRAACSRASAEQTKTRVASRASPRDGSRMVMSSSMITISRFPKCFPTYNQTSLKRLLSTSNVFCPLRVDPTPGARQFRGLLLDLQNEGRSPNHGDRVLSARCVQYPFSDHRVR